MSNAPNPILGQKDLVHSVHVGLEQIESGLRDLSGWDRTEVAARLPDDIRNELILLGMCCTGRKEIYDLPETPTQVGSD